LSGALILSSTIDLSIIIINYHSADYTRECLRSIFASNRTFQFEVIVVDNASQDGCEEMIRAEFPQVKFIASKENLGFAGANNLGFSHSLGRNILYLNPDTVVEGNAIGKLHTSLTTVSDAGMVGARLLNSDGSIQTTSITAFPSILNQVLGTDYLRRRFRKARLWGMRPLFENHHEPVSVDAISGACMMLKREVVELVQGFSMDYFMYAEDLDLCLKLRKKKIKIYYVPDAIIVHHGGESSKARSEKNYADIMIRESMVQFMKLHHGAWYASLFKIATALVAICRVALLTAVWVPAAFTKRKQLVSRAWHKWTSILGWCFGGHAWSATVPPPASR
jgi:N-acetylglucosaminyl-diphospho-decaprenol L-rhamnosyltransferase